MRFLLNQLPAFKGNYLVVDNQYNTPRFWQIRISGGSTGAPYYYSPPQICRPSAIYLSEYK